MPPVLDHALQAEAADPGTPPERLQAIFETIKGDYNPSVYEQTPVTAVLEAMARNPNLDMALLATFFLEGRWLEATLDNPVWPLLLLTEPFTSEQIRNFALGTIDTYLRIFYGDQVNHDLAWTTYQFGRAENRGSIYDNEWSTYRRNYRSQFTEFMLLTGPAKTSMGALAQRTITFERFRREKGPTYARRAKMVFRPLPWLDKLVTIVGHGT